MATSRAEREPDAGLCARCVHRRLVRTRRSTFVLCGRAADDPRFVRYPRLPVLHCPGYEPGRRCMHLG